MAWVDGGFIELFRYSKHTMWNYGSPTTIPTPVSCLQGKRDATITRQRSLRSVAGEIDKLAFYRYLLHRYDHEDRSLNTGGVWLHLGSTKCPVWFPIRSTYMKQTAGNVAKKAEESNKLKYSDVRLSQTPDTRTSRYGRNLKQGLEHLLQCNTVFIPGISGFSKIAYLWSWAPWCSYILAPD